MKHSHQYTSTQQAFDALVNTKFQLYNSLFMSLPFNRIEKTGMLLSLLQQHCEEAFAEGAQPDQVIMAFFQQHVPSMSESEYIDVLFRFIQYAERQIVLFDALEDAAFRPLHEGLSGKGTLPHLLSSLTELEDVDAVREALQSLVIRPVLTAHPTQFYPGPVLGIIHDLSKALAENNAADVQEYMQQLGKTPFFKKTQPTPYDEALNLIWYLEQVFYPAIGQIMQFIYQRLPNYRQPDKPLLQMGFWPGGDRDGNPFVTADITLQVADALRGAIIKCYYLDIRKLKRRLTFRDVDQKLALLEKELYDNLFIPGNRTTLHADSIIAQLRSIRHILNEQHNGLFGHLVDRLIIQVETFGLHFASLDIRQDSRLHRQVLQEIAQQQGWNYTADTLHEISIKLLQEHYQQPNAFNVTELTSFGQQTIRSMEAIRTIQQQNGELGCHRYVISQCQSATHVWEVLALLKLAAWQDGAHVPVDIVPLFETVYDLQHASAVMETLYQDDLYRAHLQARGMHQTIMLGFSDGTKDGGYLMANWSIYLAKKQLTSLAQRYGIVVVFFDGRGGPPSRGGGKTHQFYASMGDDLTHREIQLTIQGQTISSNFGTVDAARFNLEQLLHAGISSRVLQRRSVTLQEDQEKLLQELAHWGYEKYQSLKTHPTFLNYLENVSPLNYYSATNIASRPARRGANQLVFEDLRAIPYVGAWAQLKQNVTGYFGLGTALKTLDESGRWAEVEALYADSLYFRTLLDNAEMALCKSFLPLTAYLKDDPVYSEIWNMIQKEHEWSGHYLNKLSGRTVMMASYPIDRQSIQLREKIVLPLLTIQQYALIRLRSMPTTHDLTKSWKKLIIRTSFGIINAGRNSA